jgi:hypothetical protein
VNKPNLHQLDCGPQHCGPQLSHQDWVLELLPPSFDRFQLRHHAQLIFSGELELVNNNQMIKCDHFVWQFRVKPNQIEQWCNVQLGDSLSIGMTYTFNEGALVIDYLARNSIPTRLDIRHHITQIDPNYALSSSASELLCNIAGWQRRHDDKPSDYLLEQGGRDFRESFSATQWVVLDQNHVAS